MKQLLTCYSCLVIFQQCYVYFKLIVVKLLIRFIFKTIVWSFYCMWNNFWENLFSFSFFFILGNFFCYCHQTFPKTLFAFTFVIKNETALANKFAKANANMMTWMKKFKNAFFIDVQLISNSFIYSKYN